MPQAKTLHLKRPNLARGVCISDTSRQLRALDFLALWHFGTLALWHSGTLVMPSSPDDIRSYRQTEALQVASNMAAALDPTGITSCVELGAAVLQTIAKYVQDVIHVPDTVLEIQSRVATIDIQLKALQSLNDEGDLTDQAKEWLGKAGTLADSLKCLAELERLLGKAPRLSRGANISFPERLQQLKWPIFSQNKANEQLVRLDHHRDEIKHCLMMDTS